MFSSHNMMCVQKSQYCMEPKERTHKKILDLYQLKQKHEYYFRSIFEKFSEQVQTDNDKYSL